MDSISLILLIPFGVCFLLLFAVCCFADEIKKMCKMPSQLPRYYVPENNRSRRQRRRHHRARGRTEQNVARNGTETEDIESLMRPRSRNSSESSTNTQTSPFNVLAVVTSEVLPNGQVITSHVDAQSLLSASQTMLAFPQPLSASQIIYESAVEIPT